MHLEEIIKEIFFPYELPLGEVSIVTQYYSGSSGTGQQIGGSSVSFCLFDLELDVLTVDQEVINITIPAGEKTKVDFNLLLSDSANFLLEEPRFNVERDWYYLEAPLQIGKNTIVIDASNIAPAPFDYREGISISANYIGNQVTCLEGTNLQHSTNTGVTINLRVVPSNNLLIPSMSLVDISDNRDVYLFQGVFRTDLFFDFDNPNRPLPDNLTIKADVYNQAGSVVFEYAYTAPGEEEQALTTFRTENVTPYILHGDTNGKFFGIPKAAGFYRVRATPYTLSGGNGEAGNPLEITFEIREPFQQTILVQEVKEHPSIDELIVAPNPIVRESSIIYKSTDQKFVSLELRDLQGNLIRRIYQGDKQANQELSLKLDRQGLQTGFYILRKQTDDGIEIQRIKVE